MCAKAKTAIASSRWRRSPARAPRASFSNYGAATVDLGRARRRDHLNRTGQSGPSAYASYSGTSMATPHVTGAAALYASTHPSATAAQIKAAIINSAIATSSMAGRSVTADG